eukprot:CAMPEP_0198145290 /NCGR_PEP_ID=MMETSP1443-20131203/22519_1 /TAXON_ID=186043 /ORGANISM="Entomoneis sp., Strain CCMP2396" /LENGTH=249 /DNA_ID=CAMNT_0043808887 /DNA_START=152 /DNA_END=901 /DNA_ORIENTATION=+
MKTDEDKNDYLKLVAAKRARNEAKIKSLGLFGPKSLFRPKASAAPTKTKKRPTKKTLVRRSQRVLKQPPPSTGLPDDVDDMPRSRVLRRRSITYNNIQSPYADATAAATVETPKKVFRPRSVTPSPSSSSPNNKGGGDRRLSGKCDDQWLEDLSQFLDNVHQVSTANRNSVVRQVEKLVSGVGITYNRWPSGIVFGKSLTITPDFDFESLYDHACEYENDYGRDLGNGWLMKHPIKKLISFQEYCREMV